MKEPKLEFFDLEKLVRKLKTSIDYYHFEGSFEKGDFIDKTPLIWHGDVEYRGKIPLTQSVEGKGFLAQFFKIDSEIPLGNIFVETKDIEHDLYEHVILTLYQPLRFKNDKRLPECSVSLKFDESSPSEFFKRHDSLPIFGCYLRDANLSYDFPTEYFLSELGIKTLGLDKPEYPPKGMTHEDVDEETTKVLRYSPKPRKITQASVDPSTYKNLPITLTRAYEKAEKESGSPLSLADKTFIKNAAITELSKYYRQILDGDLFAHFSKERLTEEMVNSAVAEYIGIARYSMPDIEKAAVFAATAASKQVMQKNAWNQLNLITEKAS